MSIYEATVQSEKRESEGAVICYRNPQNHLDGPLWCFGLLFRFFSSFFFHMFVLFVVFTIDTVPFA